MYACVCMCERVQNNKYYEKLFIGVHIIAYAVISFMNKVCFYVLNKYRVNSFHDFILLYIFTCTHVTRALRQTDITIVVYYAQPETRVQTLQ